MFSYIKMIKMILILKNKIIDNLKMDHIKYVSEENTDIKSIVTWKLPFKITKSKCRSYLDLHYPDLIVNNTILSRCKSIFITLLRYVVRYSEKDYTTEVWPSPKYFWNETLTKFDQEYKFKIIIFSKELKILYGVPHPFYDDHYTHTIKELLLEDDDYYQDFIDAYYESYDYYDIFNIIKFISIKLKYEIPEELIDQIICLA